MQDQEYDECQAYVTRLLAEHRRLHTLLSDARSTIAPVGEDGVGASHVEIVRTLKQIREEIQHHFAEEEEGGCLDEAVARNPRLGAEADRVEAEHPDLLQRLDRLIDRASDPEKMTNNRPSFDKEFADLYQQLHAHEAAENRILQQGFGVPINGEGMDEP